MNTIHVSSSTYQWLKHRAKEMAQTPDEVAEWLLRQQLTEQPPSQTAPSTGLIMQTPGVLGGKPYIAGHRIGVQHVVIWHYVQGLTPETIAQEYNLEVAAVYAALTYYHTHRAAIHADIRVEQTLVAQLENQPSKLPADRVAELREEYQVEQSRYQEALARLLSDTV